MKFFNALNRTFIHVDTNISEFVFKINAEEYLVSELKEEYERVLEQVTSEVVSLEPIDKVLITIELEESGDDILTDDELANILSNYLAAYGTLFEKSTKNVVLPSESLMRKFACSPSVLSLITVSRLVNNPIQIAINRSYLDGDGKVASTERILLA